MSAPQKVTPGTWRAVEVGTSGGDNPISVYEVLADDRVRVAEHLYAADAHLIAAAPDLRDALEAILSSDHPLVRLHPDHVYVARLALAKATGGGTQ